MTSTPRTNDQRSYPGSARSPNSAEPLGTVAARMGARAFTTEIGDHIVHAVECGVGDRPLILVHGLAGSSRWWSRNLEGLCREHRVIVPDLIGFGLSRARARLPRIADFSALLLEWAETIGLDRFAIAGHSMGGQISIHLAVLAPERIDKLTLIDCSGIPRMLSARMLIRFAAEVAPLWRWGDPRFLHVIAGDAFTAGPRTLLRAIQGILLDDVRPLLNRIEAPTLVIWGEHDTLVPLRDAWEFRQGIPDARLAVLRGAAHNPMIDRPADFNRLLLRFLDGEPVGR